MWQDGLTLLASFAMTVILVPSVRILARRIGLVDQPAARKLHRDPTPLLGGLAIYLAAVLVVLFSIDRQAWDQVAAVLAGGTLLLVVGIIDDAYSLPANFKLFVAIPVAAGFLMVSGIQTVYPANLLFPADSAIASLAALGLTMLWICGITAAFSILDHMDGLCAGIAAIAAAFFYGMAAQAGQLWVSNMAIAIVGAGLGFLVWNFKPAKIFMGDGGAMFLGFMVAALGVKLDMRDYPPTNTWMIPILVLAVPVLDTSLVTISRLRRGLLPMQHPGKDHLAHRLHSLGLGQHGTVLSIYALGATAGALAFLLLRIPAVYANLVMGGLVVFGLALILTLERTPYERQESATESM